MKNFIIFNKATGKILRTGCCKSEVLLNQINNSDEAVIEGKADDLIHYIDIITGDILGKPPIDSSINKTSIDADGVDLCIISNLPNPTLIDIEDEGRWEVVDGVFEFTTETPGEYIIKTMSNLYLNVEYIVNAS